MHTPEPGIGPEIASAERARVIQLLRDSESEFLELTSGLTDAQWGWKSAPESWSVGQTAEHLVLGETAMIAMIDRALAAPANADWAEQDARKTKFLDRVLPDRSRKAAAPATLVPHRDWTPEETIARFRKGRATTLRFAEEVDRPIKDHCAEHPFPIFNMLNAYQWLLYIPLHNIRHNQQIAEILAASTTAAVEGTAR
jgi:hypothetical protein